MVVECDPSARERLNRAADRETACWRNTQRRTEALWRAFGPPQIRSGQPSEAGRSYVKAYVPYIQDVEQLWQVAAGTVHGQHTQPTAAQSHTLLTGSRRPANPVSHRRRGFLSSSAALRCGHMVLWSLLGAACACGFGGL